MAEDFPIGSLSGRIELEDRFSSALEVVKQKFSEFDSSMAKFGGNIKGAFDEPLNFAKETVKGFLEDLGPAGVGLVGVGTVVAGVGVGLYELAGHAADAGEKVLNFSRITGTAVETVGGMAAAANIGGSSLDSLQSMLFQVQRRMDAGGEAAGKFNRSLENLGISSTQFRSADPSDRVRLLSEGMHAAAGNTDLMSDALAVMGRGALENMPLLLKNFEELEERGKGVAYQWSQEDTKAAEEFSEAGAELGQRITGIATAVGVALLPAMTGVIEVASRTVLALQHVADLGGLVSGTWHLITGALGESALEEQKYAAVQDTVNGLWAKALNEGEDLGDAAETVAKQMLGLGYNLETVAEQTGLDTEEVKKLAGAMKEAEKAGQLYAAALDRVDDATTGGNDIAQVDAALKGWVKDMVDAKVKVEDMVTVTGLSIGQLSELEKEIKADDKALKDYQKALDNVNGAGTTYQSTVDAMDGATVEAIKTYLAAGVSQHDLALTYGYTAQQIEAVDKVRQSELAGAKEELKTAQALAESLSSLNKTKLEGQKATLDQSEKQNEEYYAHLLDRGKITEDQYRTYVQTSRTDLARKQEEIFRAEADQELSDLQGKQDAEQKALEDQYNEGKIDYADFIGSKENIDREYANKREEVENRYTTASKQRAQQLKDELNGVGQQGKQAFELISEASAALDGHLDSNRVKVKTLAGEIISLDEARKRFDQGNTFTYDISTMQGIEQYRKMNPGMNITWGDQQILDFAKKGGTLQQLFQMGIISMKPPSFAEGGIGDFGAGTLAVLHGKEAIVPLDQSSHNIGGTTIANFYVNGTAVQVAQQIKSIIMRELKMVRQFPAS